jgi:hypothetical protein
VRYLANLSALSSATSTARSATRVASATNPRRWAVAAVLLGAMSLSSACAGSSAAKPDVAAPQIIAADDFTRTVVTGWGSALKGGDWTTTGVNTDNFSVAWTASGAGQIRIPKAGDSPSAYLNGTSALDSNSVVDFTFDKAFSGANRVYVYLAARHAGTSQYRLGAKIRDGGSIELSLTKLISGKETSLADKYIGGLTFTARHFLRMRLQVAGVSPVSLAGKVWAVGADEPTQWQVRAEDARKPLGSGGAGLATYLSAKAKSAPLIVSFANMSSVTLPRSVN